MSLVTGVLSGIEIYPLFEDASWIPQIGRASIDVGENYIYIPDSSNSSERQSSRILRINLNTNTIENWLPSGVLPPKVQALEVNHNNSEILTFCSTGTTLYSINIQNKTLKTLGELPEAFNLIKRNENSSGYYIGSESLKNLSYLSVSGTGFLDLNLNRVRSSRFCGYLDIYSGSIYRASQVNGPNTYGPYYSYSIEKNNISSIIAGTYSASEVTNYQGIDEAYKATFALKSWAVNSGSNIHYFAADPNPRHLRYISNNTIGEINTGTSVREILGMAKTKNKLITYTPLSVHIWG